MFSHISSHKYSRVVNKRVEKVSSTLSAALWEGFLVGARCRMSQVGHTRLSKQSPSRGLNGMGGTGLQTHQTWSNTLKSMMKSIEPALPSLSPPPQC